MASVGGDDVPEEVTNFLELSDHQPAQTFKRTKLLPANLNDSPIPIQQPMPIPFVLPYEWLSLNVENPIENDDSGVDPEATESTSSETSKVSALSLLTAQNLPYFADHHNSQQSSLSSPESSSASKRDDPMALVGDDPMDKNPTNKQSPQTLKRASFVWTVDLHRRFVEAIAHLGGIHKAVPKTIMQMMSVDGLTRECLASHLQKYRLYLKRMEGVSSKSLHNRDDPLLGSTPAAPSLHQNPMTPQQSMLMPFAAPTVWPSLNSEKPMPRNSAILDPKAAFSKGSALSLLQPDIRYLEWKWEKDKEKEKGKVETHTVSDHQNGRWPSLTFSIDGREEEKEELIKLLLMPTTANSLIRYRTQVSVIAVTGAASIGKTSLVQLACSDQRVRQQFNLMAWLSKSFDSISLHKAITGSRSEEDLSTVIASSCKLLQGKNLLIVLDDIQRSPCAWSFLDTCLAPAEVATVLVTTRSERVARDIRALHIYPLMGLYEEKCWLLFQKHAFDYQECYARELSVEILEEVGRKII